MAGYPAECPGHQEVVRAPRLAKPRTPRLHAFKRAFGCEQGLGAASALARVHQDVPVAPQRDAAPQQRCRRASALMRAAMPDNLDWR